MYVGKWICFCGKIKQIWLQNCNALCYKILKIYINHIMIRQTFWAKINPLTFFLFYLVFTSDCGLGFCGWKCLYAINCRYGAPITVTPFCTLYPDVNLFQVWSRSWEIKLTSCTLSLEMAVVKMKPEQLYQVHHEIVMSTIPIYF